MSADAHVRGDDVRSVEAGERARVTLRLKAMRAVSDPIIGIALRDSGGTVVYGTNTAMQQVKTGTVPADEEIAVSFDLVAHLCGGTYSLVGGAAPSDGRVIMDWREALLTFEVIGRPAASGVADLEGRVTVTPSLGSSRRGAEPEGSPSRVTAEGR